MFGDRQQSVMSMDPTHPIDIIERYLSDCTWGIMSCRSAELAARLPRVSGGVALITFGLLLWARTKLVRVVRKARAVGDALP